MYNGQSVCVDLVYCLLDGMRCDRVSLREYRQTVYDMIHRMYSTINMGVLGVCSDRQAVMKCIVEEYGREYDDCSVSERMDRIEDRVMFVVGEVMGVRHVVDGFGTMDKETGGEEGVVGERRWLFEQEGCWCFDGEDSEGIRVTVRVFDKWIVLLKVSIANHTKYVDGVDAFEGGGGIDRKGGEVYIVVHMFDISIRVDDHTGYVSIVYVSNSRVVLTLNELSRDIVQFIRRKSRCDDMEEMVKYEKSANLIRHTKHGGLYRVDEDRLMKTIEYDRLDDDIGYNEGYYLMACGRNCRGIVRCYDVFYASNRIILILERLRGGNLSEYIYKKGRLPVKDASVILFQLLNTIKYLHDDNNMIHRDVSCDNIMMRREEDIRSVVVVDMSSSTREYRNNPAKHTNSGTVNYISPEVYSGHEYSFEIDVYSMGVILYYMITGKLPYTSELEEDIRRKTVSNEYDTSYSMCDDITSDTIDIIRNMLLTDSDNRYSVDRCLSHPFITSYNT